MSLSNYFPIWDQLSPAEQAKLQESAQKRSVPRGTVLHNGNEDCVGLLVVCSGQLRAFIFSEEGREVTIYRLFERDICLFSASCMMADIQFEVTIESEKDSEIFILPADVYSAIMERSAAVSNYTNKIMASRFSEVMWLIEQIMWKSLDKRLAAFLLEESALEKADALRITHEKIANHLGTAREVVTRMLRYFQSEGMVALTRGAIGLADRDKLEKLSV